MRFTSGRISHACALAVAAALVLLSACSSEPKQTDASRSTPPPNEAPAPTATHDSIALDGKGTSESEQQPGTSVYPGTGQFVAEPKAGATTRPSGGEGFQVSFVDTEIAAVVGSVLGEALGLRYSIDPQVKGTMSLQAARPLSHAELLPALEAALRLQGFALVESDGGYTVMPLKDAPRRASRLRSATAEGRGFGIQIVSLKFTSAAEMEKVLQPLAPEGGIARVDEARNLLLLAGSSEEIARMREIVETFDVDWLAGMSFGMFTLQYVDARTAAGELLEVFGDPKSPLAGLVRLVPIPRLNALLVVTPQPKYLADVETWIKRLDVGGTTPGRRIYVYDVQNGKADDLASSLNRILSLSGETDASDGGQPTGSGVGVAASQSGSVLGSAGGVALAPQRAGDSAATALDTAALKIVPNEENNSLLILATPSEFSVLESALKRLDVQPRQVLIEASLAEVTLTDELRYGVQWTYLGGDGPITLSESPSGGISSQFPGFSYLFTGRTDIRAVLNALESITDVDVISSPKLMVLNNREASLQIGDQVPIAVQSAVGVTDPNAPIVNAVQFRDTGVILKITPRVNKNGLVLLEVAQEVSDVVPTTSSGIDSPTIQQRKISSTIAVRSGETIALGGLIRDNRSRTRSGVPYLARIPLFGAFFRSTDKSTRRTELIIMITPRVIRDDEESAVVMDELRNEFKALERAFR